jgi:DNA-binding transcriptional LysR family regulator
VRQQSDLQELAVFSKVVETKSFSAAARSFDTTTSAVSKRIARLEQRLGVRLLSRTTRRVSLTEAGASLYAHALRILADVAEAEDAVARLGGSIRGTLRISAPTILGEREVASLIPQLLAAHPDLRVEMSLTDRFVNLAEEALDCAVRVGALGDSSLVGVRIGEVGSAVCAAPSYLASRGTPRVPHDLAMHECIRFSLISMAREWRFRGEDKRELSVPVTGRLVLNSGAAIATACVAGAGVARLPLFLVEDALARGELVEVLRDWKTKPSPVHVVYASTPQVTPKLRAFIDLMRSSFSVGKVGKPAVITAPKRRR